jgi:hypothetical protein
MRIDQRDRTGTRDCRVAARLIDVLVGRQL